MLHWQYNKLNRVDCLQLQEILRGDDIETQVGFLFFFNLIFFLYHIQRVEDVPYKIFSYHVSHLSGGNILLSLQKFVCAITSTF